MKQYWIVAAIAIASAGTSVAGQTTRIGTFHKPSIVVAYYRSPMWAGILKSKAAEMEQAKAANDTKKIQELDRWGNAGQETAHRQLAGEAPMDNILEALRPAFPEIAAKAQVAAVAVDLPYADASVQTVDVTDLLLDWLKADARTRTIVKDLQSQKVPSPPSP